MASGLIVCTATEHIGISRQWNLLICWQSTPPQQLTRELRIDPKPLPRCSRTRAVAFESKMKRQCALASHQKQTTPHSIKLLKYIVCRYQAVGCPSPWVFFDKCEHRTKSLRYHLPIFQRVKCDYRPTRSDLPASVWLPISSRVQLLSARTTRWWYITSKYPFQTSKRHTLYLEK